ncbi:MAG TPA: hypothetical protein VMF13_18655 [Luteitalea sp.]|nr:hypothetical protein [Luteitalea sp.]
MARARRSNTSTAVPARPATAGLDPHVLATATDDHLAALFREVTTLPLDTFVNAGGHRIDVASHMLANDEHWKGWLPKGLALRDIFTRLGTGYAKRFWKQGNRYLGETLYLDGRIRVKHLLEEFTIDTPTNGLDPGRYILLRYTDPGFEHLFYDVMKAADDGVIVYGGYSGKFPHGRRGFTSVLMRRYTFAEMGVRDHVALAKKGKRPTADALAGRWRLDAVATSDHVVPVAMLTCTPGDDGAPVLQWSAAAQHDVLVPSFVDDHFSGPATPLLRELRAIDATTIVGTWSLTISPLYARFVSASPGLFHKDAEKGRGQYTLRYVLTRV